MMRKFHYSYLNLVDFELHLEGLQKSREAGLSYLNKLNNYPSSDPNEQLNCAKKEAYKFAIKYRQEYLYDRIAAAFFKFMARMQ